MLRSRLPTKSESDVSVVQRPCTVSSPPSCFTLGQPEHVGQRLADFVDHVDAPALALAQLLDERDALLQLLLLLVERRHLREDGLEVRLLALRVRSGVDQPRLLASSDHHHQPMPSAVTTSSRLQTSVTFWPRSNAIARFLAFRARRRGG